MGIDQLDPLVGEWTTTATHPMTPGPVSGVTTMEWLGVEKFLVVRSRVEHELFPDSLSLIGEDDEGLAMHYFDSRGVRRLYRSSFEGDVWRLWRDDDPEFRQRFEGKVTADAVDGLWQVCEDGRTWNDDVAITYRRRA
jgi:hypothetical protein